LNSSVNLRRGRFGGGGCSFLADGAGFFDEGMIDTQFQGPSTLTHGVRQTGAAPQLTIHADRGSPMIANSVADLMSAMGVTKSHSRPRVSNDNPYIEAQFKTLKYRPDFPDRFADIAATRAWMRRYEHWYNHVHYHSAIGYQRPADLHDGTHHTITERRNEVLQRAYQHRPDRFRRPPSPPSVPTVAWINKPTIQTT
jgi:putative transposase